MREVSGVTVVTLTLNACPFDHLLKLLDKTKLQITRHPARQAKRAHHNPIFPGKKLSPRSFLGRVSVDTIAAIGPRMKLIYDIPRKRIRRHELAVEELAAFNGDAKALLAAISVQQTPTTALTKAAVLGAVRPDLRHLTRPAIVFARKAKSRPEGAPKKAPRITPDQFNEALRHAPPSIRSAMIVMWASVSRTVDLRHFQVSLVQNCWKITYVAREEADGTLVAPKSDPSCSRLIVKWVPQHPLFDPMAKATWTEIDEYTKLVGTTPHGIRGSAIHFLESQGFNTSQILMLSGHTPATDAPGMQSYLSLLPNDPAAQMSMILASLLLKQISL